MRTLKISSLLSVSAAGGASQDKALLAAWR